MIGAAQPMARPRHILCRLREFLIAVTSDREAGNCRCATPLHSCGDPGCDHGDEERCGRCGGPNVSWSAQSPLWNYVMRGNDINGEPRYSDLVCMTCFVACAVEAGLAPTGWRLTLAPEPDGLVYETPSGRVWDEKRFLWVDPPPRVVALVNGPAAGQMTLVPGARFAKVLTVNGKRYEAITDPDTGEFLYGYIHVPS